MWGIVISLLVGIAVGYFSPGRQDKRRMFMRGLLWAVVLAVVLVAIGYATGNDPLTAAGLGGSFVSLAISFVVILLVFLLGVWIGDWLETRKERGAMPPATRPPSV